MDYHYLMSLKADINSLTPVQKQMLAIFMKHDEKWLSRKDIARMLGKPHLSRYDIQTVNKLAALNLIVKRKRRFSDIHGKPSNYLGSNMALATVFWQYHTMTGLVEAIRLIKDAKQSGAAPVKRSLISRLFDW